MTSNLYTSEVCVTSVDEILDWSNAIIPLAASTGFVSSSYGLNPVNHLCEALGKVKNESLRLDLLLAMSTVLGQYLTSKYPDLIFDVSSVTGASKDAHRVQLDDMHVVKLFDDVRTLVGKLGKDL